MAEGAGSGPITRNAKAWPRVFAGREGLFGSLLSLLEWVDGDVGPYGGHLRAPPVRG